MNAATPYGDERMGMCKESIINKTALFVSVGVVMSLALVFIIVTTIRCVYKPLRPRIKKTYVVHKNVTPTPLTCRPTTEQCEITIENCCNMNICDTVSGSLLPHANQLLEISIASKSRTRVRVFIDHVILSVISSHVSIRKHYRRKQLRRTTRKRCWITPTAIWCSDHLHVDNFAYCCLTKRSELWSSLVRQSERGRMGDRVRELSIAAPRLLCLIRIVTKTKYYLWTPKISNHLVVYEP